MLELLDAPGECGAHQDVGLRRDERAERSPRSRTNQATEQRIQRQGTHRTEKRKERLVQPREIHGHQVGQRPQRPLPSAGVTGGQVLEEVVQVGRARRYGGDASTTVRKVGREIELIGDVDDVPIAGEAGLAREHDRGGDDRPCAGRRAHRPEIDSPAPAINHAPQRPSCQPQTGHGDDHVRRGGQRRESRVVAEQPSNYDQRREPHGHHEHRRHGHWAGGATHRQARTAAQHEHQGREDDPGQ